MIAHHFGGTAGHDVALARPLRLPVRIEWPSANELHVAEAGSGPPVEHEMSAADNPQQVTVVFHNPALRPGTPQAQAQGCLCRFESNMEAGFLAAERGYEDETIVVIHQDCPLHEIVRKPMGDVLGEQA
jgi:hypothetical protein